MEIRSLVWDGGNEPHLAAHGISRDDVEELVASDAWEVGNHPEYPGQMRIIGMTPYGRWLTIALEPAGDPGVWRPITGWTATRAEIAYYWGQDE